MRERQRVIFNKKIDKNNIDKKRQGFVIELQKESTMSVGVGQKINENISKIEWQCL